MLILSFVSTEFGTIVVSLKYFNKILNDWVKIHSKNKDSTQNILFLSSSQKIQS